MTDKIKILFLAADDSNSLGLGEEARAIEEAIRREARRDAFEFATALAVRPRDLQATLLRHKPQIVHFAGHASSEAGIHLVGDFGGSHAVGPAALASLFAAMQGCIRVVLLNACHSHALTEAFSDVVDYMIGMDAPVDDGSAIRFVESFYGALACGETVDRAFTMGQSRLELEGEGVKAAATPTLRVRRGVDRTRPLIPAPLPEFDESRPPPPTGGGIHVSGNARVGNAANVNGNGNTTTIGTHHVR